MAGAGRRDAPAQDEIDETLTERAPDADRQEVEEQDFAARNVAMTNTLPGQAAAGAIIGSGGEMTLEPTAGEEAPLEEEEPTAARDRASTEDRPRS